MPEQPKQNEEDFYDQFKADYQKKIKQQLNPDAEFAATKKVISHEYLRFKENYMPPHMNWYERGCSLAEKLVKFPVAEKDRIELERAVSICHLNITPSGALSFAYLFPLVYMFIGIAVSVSLVLIATGQISYFFMTFFLLTGIVIFFPLQKLPMIFANNWRLKASNQMVLCIFYIVSYMRHTSNLELAIKFTTDHLSPPLSLDLQKVLWNVETEKFESVKESLENYLETWREYNMEFVEALHLIEASLYESSEDRRLAALEKGLALILEETYEKMLHYAQDLRSPITMLHMLGIILPILGLVILPLVVSFMDTVQWYHIAMIYNVALPIGVFYMGKIILSKRPTGYGDTDITKLNPSLAKYKRVIIQVGKKELSFSPLMIALAVGGVLVFIGLLPLIIHALDTGDEPFDLVMDEYGQVSAIHTFDDASNPRIRFQLLGYKKAKTSGNVIGPFGLGATLLSMFFILGIGLGLGLYYRMTTSNLIKIRDETKELEAEFAAALFQLGGRLGDGLPAEIAFSKVAELSQETKAGRFFYLVSNNISQRGMDVERAIFDPKVGAIMEYPSNLIKSSMKVFIESAKKGPHIASQTLINISMYIKEMHKVDERLKDLMAEVISSMNSQISFLTPAISGIVIGITSMITSVLGKLGQQMTNLSKDTGAGAGGAAGLLEMFGDSIPTFYFQIIVGLYVVQISFILTGLVSVIQNGVDKLTENYLLGQNLVKGTMLYILIATVVVLIFNSIAAVVLSGISLA